MPFRDGERIVSDQIIATTKDAVTTIRIARPAKKNALTQAMYTRLAEALEAATADRAVRAVILTGDGDFFTAGNDLNDFLASGGSADLDRPVFRFMRALTGCEAPVIAAVNGPGIGIGTTLLLHCDFVYLAPDAYLHMPFADLALVPEFGASAEVPGRLGRLRANELLLLGDKIPAEQAVRDGLATAIVDDPLAHAGAVAARLAQKAPQALRFSKRLMRRAPEAFADRVAAEATLFAEQLNSAEARETMQAFVEKRKPDYSKIG